MIIKKGWDEDWRHQLLNNSGIALYFNCPYREVRNLTSLFPFSQSQLRSSHQIPKSPSFCETTDMDLVVKIVMKEPWIMNALFADSNPETAE